MLRFTQSHYNRMSVLQPFGRQRFSTLPPYHLQRSRLRASQHKGSGVVQFVDEMAISLSVVEKCCHSSANSIAKVPKPFTDYKLQLRRCFDVASQKTLFCKRRTVLCGGASLATIFTLNCILSPLPLQAAENDQKGQEDDGDKGVFDSLKSLFDPNEKTKSGKILPKAYLNSAREVVKTLRESLKEDPKDIAKFRRTADAAKESIREYLNGWRSQQTVVAEESYVAIVKAIRSLASFYSKAGPFAPLPEEVKSGILDQLNTAEAFL
ncbi:hypothetical protein MRB53_002753 [Persea americana]|uniref:Uncharacterized protein n=1 Tax=Persea americana TaxID=3435 RepID=A0ACC2MWC1_PERAE|nr:hypothetical protein MRB53_002753 [Persea americana]